MHEVGGSSPPAPTTYPILYQRRVTDWSEMTSDKDFKQEILKLARVQQLDSEIYDLSGKKESFPVRLKEMDESLEGKRAGLSQAEETLKKLQVEKNEKEVDIKGREEKVKKHEGELYQIKNNKEYKALQGEIESIKADISLLEESVLKLYDEIEAAQNRVEAEKKVFEEEQRSVEAEKSAINAEEKELDSRLDGLRASRQQFMGGIDPEVLDKYERILKNKGRVALAAVKGNFCGECNMHLRPQLINEAKLLKALVFCENCGRMLYEAEE